MATEQGRQDVLLRPGEYAVGDARCRMRTVLGSCVSITLWHPIYRIGAMSHFMLARRNEKRATPLDARYGEEALLLMLDELRQANVERSQCEAKIFGGGDMFPAQRAAHAAVSVGRSNGEAARSLLLAHRIPIHSESLFGVGHRQIVFDIATGDVWARQVQPGTGSGLMPFAGDNA